MILYRLFLTEAMGTDAKVPETLRDSFLLASLTVIGALEGTVATKGLKNINHLSWGSAISNIIKEENQKGFGISKKKNSLRGYRRCHHGRREFDKYEGQKANGASTGQQGTRFSYC